jgi:hypothetical protein
MGGRQNLPPGGIALGPEITRLIPLGPKWIIRLAYTEMPQNTRHTHTEIRLQPLVVATACSVRSSRCTGPTVGHGLTGCGRTAATSVEAGEEHKNLSELVLTCLGTRMQGILNPGEQFGGDRPQCGVSYSLTC